MNIDERTSAAEEFKLTMISMSKILSSNGRLVDPREYANLKDLQKASDFAKNGSEYKMITQSLYSKLVTMGTDINKIQPFMDYDEAEQLIPKPKPKPKDNVTMQLNLSKPTTQRTLSELLRAKVPASKIPDLEDDALKLLAKHTTAQAVETPVKQAVISPDPSEPANKRPRHGQ